MARGIAGGIVKENSSARRQVTWIGNYELSLIAATGDGLREYQVLSPRELTEQETAEQHSARRGPHSQRQETARQVGGEAGIPAACGGDARELICEEAVRIKIAFRLRIGYYTHLADNHGFVVGALRRCDIVADSRIARAGDL
jgi:hypothetical protein